jgi:phosphoribosyl-AMP cyclohydrolase
MSDAARETGTTLDIKFDAQGLVPAIVQDVATHQVLMVGWMNQAALQQTLTTRKATFYSRSRNKMWVKGEESGHVQEVVEARVDCDQDVVLLLCKTHGPACHVGYHTCFYRAAENATPGKLRFVEKQVFDPVKVYKKK